MNKKKIEIKLKSNEDWNDLINEVANSGYDFYTQDKMSAINIFLNSESGFSLKLRQDGRWELE